MAGALTVTQLDLAYGSIVMNYKLWAATAIASLVSAVQPVRAEVSANLGWASEYIFRGVFQEDSSAFGGLDYTQEGGLYAGTWVADVGQGLETDVYFGFAGGDRLTWKIGYTGYFYTDDFDDTYNEVNLGAGYSIASLDVAIGRWDGFGNDQDYVFSTLTLAPDGLPYVKFGSFSRDFDGDYVESGYVWSLEEHGIDLSIAVTWSDDLAVSDGDDNESGDYALVFGIRKSIGIR
jgi:uncharacterized protein (TIGR02001 family)